MAKNDDRLRDVTGEARRDDIEASRQRRVLGSHPGQSGWAGGPIQPARVPVG